MKPRGYHGPLRPSTRLLAHGLEYVEGRCLYCPNALPDKTHERGRKPATCADPECRRRFLQALKAIRRAELRGIRTSVSFNDSGIDRSHCKTGIEDGTV